MTMRILMVTPHLPPHQAANALLPHLLGEALRSGGHEVRFVTLGDQAQRSDVARVRRRAQSLRATRLPQLIEALETTWRATPLVKWADVVHIHSNTWMNQVAAELSAFHRRPYILTHYGTEIWHHDGRDATFRRLNRHAAHVAYYSEALMARGQELAVPAVAASVIYPPVGDVFQPLPCEARASIRSRYVPENGPLLLNVKRLHPLADQTTLLEAFARVRAARPDARLLIAGIGEMEAPLKARAAALGLDSTVQFLGLVPNEQVALLQGAADLFVLSSALEATPTVALEALASGTPVVSTDNPGGVELTGIFGADVKVVPRKEPELLARALLDALNPARRVAPGTLRIINERFRLAGVAGAYCALYHAAIAR
jgi:glycosyltransferase involved in cell wall biosynthesis